MGFTSISLRLNLLEIVETELMEQQQFKLNAVKAYVSKEQTAKLTMMVRKLNSPIISRTV
jgi:hypothetical protein